MRARRNILGYFVAGAIIGSGIPAWPQTRKTSERISITIDARYEPIKAAREYHEKVIKRVLDSQAKTIRIYVKLLVSGRRGFDVGWLRIRDHRLRRLYVHHTIIITRGNLRRELHTSLLDLESDARVRTITQSTIIR